MHKCPFGKIDGPGPLVHGIKCLLFLTTLTQNWALQLSQLCEGSSPRSLDSIGESVVYGAIRRPLFIRENPPGFADFLKSGVRHSSFPGVDEPHLILKPKMQCGCLCSRPSSTVAQSARGRQTSISDSQSRTAERVVHLAAIPQLQWERMNCQMEGNRMVHILPETSSFGIAAN